MANNKPKKVLLLTGKRPEPTPTKPPFIETEMGVDFDTSNWTSWVVQNSRVDGFESRSRHTIEGSSVEGAVLAIRWKNGGTWVACVWDGSGRLWSRHDLTERDLNEWFLNIASMYGLVSVIKKKEPWE